MLYAIIFSQQICFPSSRPPCTLSGIGEFPTRHLSEASRALFFYPEDTKDPDTKWVTSLFWLRYKFSVRTCPLFYFQNQMASLIPPEA